MPTQYTLTQGSILIDVPTSFCAAFVGLTPERRDLTGTHFRAALHGGDDPSRVELLADLHQSNFRQVLAVPSSDEATAAELAAAANTVIEAYNARQNEFGLEFETVTDGAAPDCVRWVWDPDLEAWIAIYNYGLTVANGNASGADFNWLPLADARQQAGFALPTELAFLMNGQDIVVDLRYHLTLTFVVE